MTDLEEGLPRTWQHESPGTTPVNGSTIGSSRQKDNFEILEFQPGDSINPYNWSESKKWLVGGCLLVGTLLLPLNGTSITIAAREINAEFGISDEHFTHSYVSSPLPWYTPRLPHSNITWILIRSFPPVDGHQLERRRCGLRRRLPATVRGHRRSSWLPHLLRLLLPDAHPPGFSDQLRNAGHHSLLLRRLCGPARERDRQHHTGFVGGRKGSLAPRGTLHPPVCGRQHAWAPGLRRCRAASWMEMVRRVQYISHALRY